MNTLLNLFRTHRHHWGIPHKRQSDNAVIQTCYGCSQQRKVNVNFSDRVDLAVEKKISERLSLTAE